MSELKDVSGGEWRVAGDGRDYSHLVESNVYSIISKHNQWLAECYGNTPEEALANARLMAAAKDMAEALKLAKRALWKCSLDKVGDCQEILSACASVDAALKKAGAA